MRRLEKEQASSGAAAPEKKAVREPADPHKELKARVHRKLIEELEHPSTTPDSEVGDVFEEYVRTTAEEILTQEGESWLLRVSDRIFEARKRREYDAVSRVAQLSIHTPRPISFGCLEQGVYGLYSWLEGEDCETALPSLPVKTQYVLGISAGRQLKAIHGLPAPSDQPPWGQRFENKMNKKIEQYRQGDISMPSDDKMLFWAERGRYLLGTRPQCLQHGDFHVGNMVITPEGTLGVIDFNRCDYGDPWEEYNRIVWSAHFSPAFAAGQVDGYFDTNIPTDFWILLATYLSVNALGSLAWAKPFGPKEVDTMLRNGREIINYYPDDDPVPVWYILGRKAGLEG
jgi:serine/threonine-protein kinase